jgi:hypothetical protein
MKFTCKPINARNRLSSIMTHQIVCDLPGFFVAREWCWATWGPGCESEHWFNCHWYLHHRYPWCWDASKFHGAAIDNGKIYTSTEAQMMEFVLRWS